jgi:hypothetical protein
MCNPKLTFPSAFVLILAAMNVTAFAVQDPADLVEDGSFETPLPASWSTHVAHANIVDWKIHSVGKVLHLEFGPRNPGKNEGPLLRIKTTGMIHLGDTVAVRLFLRGDPKGATDDLKVKLLFLATEDSSKKLIDASFNVGSAWKEYRFATVVHNQYLAGEVELSLFSNSGAGILDIAHVRIQELGDQSPNSVHPTKV